MILRQVETKSDKLDGFYAAIAKKLNIEGDYESKNIDVDLDEACFKALDSKGSGSFSGYVATWDVDSVNDRFEKSAFDDFLEVFIKEGFAGDNHDWGSPIGIIKDAKTDDKGLWIDVEFHSTPDAQQVRTKALERMKAGKAVKLSIGFFIVKKKQEKGIRVIQNALPVEGSIVGWPANMNAEVVTVKGAASFDDALSALKTLLPKKDEDELRSELKSFLDQISEEKNASTETTLDGTKAAPQTKGKILGDIEPNMAYYALENALWRLNWLIYEAMQSGKDDVIELIAAGFDELRDTAIRIVSALLADDSGEKSAAFTALFKQRLLPESQEDPEPGTKAGATLNKKNRAALKAAVEGIQGVLDTAEGEEGKEGGSESSELKSDDKDEAANNKDAAKQEYIKSIHLRSRKNGVA